MRKTSHPIDAIMVGCEVENIQRGKGNTYIVETIIVGMTRNGKTSKMKRESNQAVGLVENMGQENTARLR